MGDGFEHVDESIVVECPQAAAWRLIGDFLGVLEVVGVEVTGQRTGVGALRTVGQGETAVVERLETFDDQSMELSYSMPERGWLPVLDYEARMQVSAQLGGASGISWSARFRTEGAAGSTIAAQLSERFAHYLVLLKAQLEAPAAETPAER